MLVRFCLTVLVLIFGVASYAFTVDEESSADKCFVPCTNKTNTCVSHTCYRSGVTTVCSLYSSHSAQKDKHAIECMSPEKVQGLPEFCKGILDKTKHFTIQNLHLDKTTIRSTTTENVGKSSQIEGLCIGMAVLVSIAVGSFAAGCFVMALILALCKYINPCTDKNGYARKNSNNSSSSSFREQRTGDHGTTQPRSPSHVSVDSGLSSTQVQTPHHGHLNQRPTAGGHMIHFNSLGPSTMTKGDNDPCYQSTDLDGVYAPGSECSYRDYQSIQGSSVYAPSSEGGNSDYSCHPTHRVLIMRENGEIYHPSSESSGNDYSSLKGHRGTNGGVYYAISDGSYKDYTSLLDEQELSAGYCDVEDTLIGASAANGDSTHDNIKFRVSGFVIPKAKLSAKGKPVPVLEDVNEYEVVHSDDIPIVSDDYTRPVDDISNVLAVESDGTDKRRPGEAVGDIAMCDFGNLRSKLARTSLPHEYLVLETDNNEN